MGGRYGDDPPPDFEGLLGYAKMLKLPSFYQETRAQWLFACMADFMHPECSGDFPQAESHAMEAIQKLDLLS